MDWDDIDVAADGTHHVRCGTALYAERFDEVLPFHEPGLAPVRRERRAWHIGPRGLQAYSRRFLRTFGFYQGRAAVTSDDGCHHILPSGEDAYVVRYDWCGNYQGSLCTVRESGGGYLHLDHDGRPAYGTRWSYAGDFRDGIAVVQAPDGKSTHIDTSGVPLHGRWFLDLDVFHKSYARARDADGWMHVDRTGRPIYARRFAAVEPFYNGQARVEGFDGSLEVIDERGGTRVVLRSPLRSDFAALSGDMVGFWRTQTICAAVELGVIESLPGTAEDVARRCGLVEERSGRLLRALAELHLVGREGSAWKVTPRGALLRRCSPLTLAHAAVEYGRHLGEMWTPLPDALRGAAGWAAPDIFGALACDPDRAIAHHQMLASYALHDYVSVPAALPLRGDEVVIDAGGGTAVLGAMLLRRFPALRVVVLERPEVAARTEVPVDLSQRLSLRSHDLFQPWGLQADAVVLARVLHDWDDEAACRLLGHARAALHRGGHIFIVEMLLSEAGAAGGLCDLHLLMATGGQERTESEYASLLGATGFSLDRVIRLPALPSIVVAEVQ